MDIQRLIRLAPVQERFGPSLPQLLAPRIDRLPALARRVGAVIALVILAVIIALVLRTRDPVYRGSVGPVHFTVTWPHALTRETPARGELLLLRQQSGSSLLASFEVTPLHLPRYAGEISGLLPIVAINYERGLERRYGALFTPWSLGRTRIINTPAFTFTYKLVQGGETYFGRVVFITPHLTGDRTGLILSMLQGRPSVILRRPRHPRRRRPTPSAPGGSLQEPLAAPADQLRRATEFRSRSCRLAPLAPATEVSPVAPAVAVAPVPAIWPVGPVEEVADVVPASRAGAPPWRPVAPVAPVVEVAPVAPVAPVVDVAPVEEVVPVAAVGPLAVVGPVAASSPSPRSARWAPSRSCSRPGRRSWSVTSWVVGVAVVPVAPSGKVVVVVTSWVVGVVVAPVVPAGEAVVLAR